MRRWLEIGLVCVMGLVAPWAQSEPVTARAAAEALTRGATAWDLRVDNTDQVTLPGAVRVDHRALEQWLRARDITALATAVSNAGIDLSREVVVFGEPGDAEAQAIVASLLEVASGKLLWLVGGLAEWQLAGLPVQLAPSAGRYPVPQHLAMRSDVSEAATLAAASRRAVTDRPGLVQLTRAY